MLVIKSAMKNAGYSVSEGDSFTGPDHQALVDFAHSQGLQVNQVIEKYIDGKGNPIPQDSTVMNTILTGVAAAEVVPNLVEAVVEKVEPYKGETVGAEATPEVSVAEPTVAETPSQEVTGG